MEIDLNDVFKGDRGSISISAPETSEERLSRLKREDRDHLKDLVFSYIVFSVVVVGIASIFAFLSYEIFFNKMVDPESKKWSQTILASLITGCISFLFGQASAKKR